MKKFIAASILSLASCCVFAETETSLPTVTFVNHYGKELSFEVQSRIPEWTLISLHKHFVLNDKEQISSLVGASSVDKAAYPYSNPSAYIAFADITDSSHEGYFGVGRNVNKPSSAEVSGYISEGIAYSWNNCKDKTVIFCKPEYYAKHNHC